MVCKSTSVDLSFNYTMSIACLPEREKMIQNAKIREENKKNIPSQLLKLTN